MLIFNRYDIVAPHVDEIVAMGYGFSVLDEPTPTEAYSCNDVIDVLKDWGWSGRSSGKPEWLEE